MIQDIIFVKYFEYWVYYKRIVKRKCDVNEKNNTALKASVRIYTVE